MSTPAGSDRSDTTSHDTYAGLRALALHAGDDGGVVARHGDPGVVGVVVDIPVTAGMVTLVAVADGTTSLYTSTGGGTIGAGATPAVATASEALLAAAQQQRDGFVRPADDALPPSGRVRFHLLSSEGRRSVDVPEDAFWGKVGHPLMPVIAAAQGVISSLQRA